MDARRTLARTARWSTPLCALAVAALSLSMWNEGMARIEDFSSTLVGIRRLVSGDSEHYLAIADALREGDFRMEHVQPTGGADRAHRQPGYPALLAVAQKLGLQGAPSLARLNLAVLVASLWIAFLVARIATGSALAALLAAAVVYDAHFLFDIATERLLTEPLYVAVSLGAVGAFLRYARRAGPISLLVAAAMSGLAYLVRVNGLFLAGGLAVALLIVDLRRARDEEPDVIAPDLVLHLPLAAYAAALALLLLVTVPSWLPRLVYTGNPIYHGYLSNYLWVDDHEQAHAAGPPQYDWHSYLAEHDAGDVARRSGYGLRRVFFDTPRDKYGLLASVALMLSVVVVISLADLPGIAVLVAAVLQALPLAWTALANPARRLPATALLPFAALLIAAAAAALLRQVHDPADDD